MPTICQSVSVFDLQDGIAYLGNRFQVAKTGKDVAFGATMASNVRGWQGGVVPAQMVNPPARSLQRDTDAPKGVHEIVIASTWTRGLPGNLFRFEAQGSTDAKMRNHSFPRGWT